MRKFRWLFAIALAASMQMAMAQEDISGTWAGELAVTPTTKLNIHFVLTPSDGGQYSAVVTSPDPGGVKDIDASSVSFESDKLVLTVDSLNGKYEGTYADGAFDGEWTQQGQSFPLRLEPYVKPTISQAVIDALTGSWVGSLELPVGKLPVVFRFLTNDQGEFIGQFDSPEEGATNLPVTTIELDNGNLHLQVSLGNAVIDYKGTFDGEVMQGTFNPPSPLELPLTMHRGEYKPASADLKLSDADKARLEGSWVGSLDSPNAGTLTVVFRFETDDAGEFVGFMDSPDQGVTDLPISDVKLEGDTVSFSIARAQAKYSGTIGSDGLDGTWAQGPLSLPLAMRQGEYTPPAVAATPLELTSEDMQTLAGTWRGKIANALDIVFRLETNDAGEAVGFLDVPMQNLNNMPISSATFTGDQLTLRMAKISVEFTATVSGGAMTGQWHQGAAVQPLNLSRD